MLADEKKKREIGFEEKRKRGFVCVWDKGNRERV